jgi:hypothetical protein
MLKVLAKFRKPAVTVEQIHAEFDSGEERLRQECEKILSELEIPTQTQVERKAQALKQLGFTAKNHDT